MDLSGINRGIAAVERFGQSVYNYGAQKYKSYVEAKERLYDAEVDHQFLNARMATIRDLGELERVVGQSSDYNEIGTIYDERSTEIYDQYFKELTLPESQQKYQEWAGLEIVNRANTVLDAAVKRHVGVMIDDARKGVDYSVQSMDKESLNSWISYMRENELLSPVSIDALAIESLHLLELNMVRAELQKLTPEEAYNEAMKGEIPEWVESEFSAEEINAIQEDMYSRWNRALLMADKQRKAAIDKEDNDFIADLIAGKITDISSAVAKYPALANDRPSYDWMVQQIAAQTSAGEKITKAEETAEEERQAGVVSQYNDAVSGAASIEELSAIQERFKEVYGGLNDVRKSTLDLAIKKKQAEFEGKREKMERYALWDDEMNAIRDATLESELNAIEDRIDATGEEDLDESQKRNLYAEIDSQRDDIKNKKDPETWEDPAVITTLTSMYMGYATAPDKQKWYDEGIAFIKKYNGADPETGEALGLPIKGANSAQSWFDRYRRMFETGADAQFTPTVKEYIQNWETYINGSFNTSLRLLELRYHKSDNVKAQQLNDEKMRIHNMLVDWVNSEEFAGLEDEDKLTKTDAKLKAAIRASSIMDIVNETTFDIRDVDLIEKQYDAGILTQDQYREMIEMSAPGMVNKGGNRGFIFGRHRINTDNMSIVWNADGSWGVKDYDRMMLWVREEDGSWKGIPFTEYKKPGGTIGTRIDTDTGWSDR